MIEGVTKAALETLLAQGTGWVIAVLFLLAIIALTKKNDKLQLVCDANRTGAENAVREQFEKRLNEFKVIVDALNRSSEALAFMRVSVDARTEAINQLVAGFANLVRDLEANRERWADKGELWSGQLADLQRRVEDLQRRSRPLTTAEGLAG